jgi:hypothetical protein
MQDNYINNYEKMVEYHYMQYAIEYPKNDDISMLAKTAIMTCVFFIDLGLLLSGLISQTLGVGFNLYFVLVEIIIQTNNSYRQNFFNFFDLEADSFHLSATTYYYNTL